MAPCPGNVANFTSAAAQLPLFTSASARIRMAAGVVGKLRANCKASGRPASTAVENACCSNSVFCGSAFSAAMKLSVAVSKSVSGRREPGDEQPPGRAGDRPAGRPGHVCGVRRGTRR